MLYNNLNFKYQSTATNDLAAANNLNCFEEDKRIIYSCGSPCHFLAIAADPIWYGAQPLHLSDPEITSAVRIFPIDYRI